MHIPHRIAPKIIVVAVAAGFLALAVILLTPSPAPAEPVISWTPESVTQTFLAGEGATVTSSIRITTDKPRYSIGQTVRIKINNDSDQKTYVWSGPCSLTLDRYNGNAWETSSTSWSGCPSCGIQRELPDPLFLSPEVTEEIKWNQIVTWCEGSTLKTGQASGRFRFAFQYAEDEPGCQSTPNPLRCWLRHRDKKWQSTYSNEFTVSEHVDRSP